MKIHRNTTHGNGKCILLINSFLLKKNHEFWYDNILLFSGKCLGFVLILFVLHERQHLKFWNFAGDRHFVDSSCENFLFSSRTIFFRNCDTLGSLFVYFLHRYILVGAASWDSIVVILFRLLILDFCLLYATSASTLSDFIDIQHRC